MRIASQMHFQSKNILCCFCFCIVFLWVAAAQAVKAYLEIPEILHGFLTEARGLQLIPNLSDSCIYICLLRGKDHCKAESSD